jgi:hypothetical protein
MDTPIISAMSVNKHPQTAVAELAAQFAHAKLGFLLFFCSTEYPLAELAEALEQQFPELPKSGCTSAGELNLAGYAQGSIVALGFEANEFTVAIGPIQQLDTFDLLQAQALIDSLLPSEAEFGQPQRQSFALTLFDGLSAQEELALFSLQTALGRIPHFGGSAGDDNQLTDTYVYFAGAFHTNAAVLLMFTTALPFRVFSTHHMEPRADKFVVTAASADTRTVYELNAEPAAAAYAQFVGVSEAQLNATVFAMQPLAVRMGNEYFVRSIQRVNADGSLTFYCAVGEGAVLTAMETQPILPDLEQRFAAIEGEIGVPLVTVGCDCVLRRLECEQRAEEAAASAFYQQHHVVGFNTYGEHFNGIHINQTFTGVVIGRGVYG